MKLEALRILRTASPSWIVLAAVTSLAALLVVSAPASAARVGAAPAGQKLQLVIPLVMDDAGLQRFAHAVSTPGSPEYGAYEPVAMLSERFGATPAVRERAIGFLRAAGASNVTVNPTGMFAEATMSVAAAQRTFSTQLDRFAIPGGRTFIAPVLRGSASAAGVQVPGGLRGVATGVVGLDTRPLAGVPRPGPRVRAPGGYRGDRSDSRRGHAAAVRQPYSGYFPDFTGMPSGCVRGVASGGFTPNQYLTAYNYNRLRSAGLDGKGERVALIEIDGFKYSDIRTYAQCFGLNIPRLSVYYVGSRHALPAGGETTLDLEVLDSAAPNLDAIQVYENAGDAADVTRSLVLPLINPGAKPEVVSASLGLCEPFMLEAFGRSGIASVERDVQLAAATGITLVASSGDQGSAACVDAKGHVLDHLAVSYPASSPFVTAVGGTNLVLNPDNSIKQQPVWNDTYKQLGGGGGGISGLFTRPAYQSHVVPVNRRVVPDVAMLADLAPGYAIYCSATADPSCADNPWHTVGGTSAAAPLFAGGMALVDQDLHRHERELLGFVNPLLYAAGSSQYAGGVFSDVTSIGNDVGPYIPGGNGQLLGCCAAGPGFDAASGWGSINLAGLDEVANAFLPKYGDVAIEIPRRQRPLHQRALNVELHCSDECTVYAFAVVTLGNGSDFAVRTKLVHFARHGNKLLPIRFSRAELSRMRSALAHHRDVQAEVFGVGVRTGGVTAKVTAGLALRIRS